MASSVGVVLLLFGGFLMAIGYQMLSDCLGAYKTSDCVNPVSPAGAGAGALGLYLGGILVTLAVIMLAGRDIARLFGKLSGTGPG